MAERPRSSARLRSTFDRVLVHDVKNVSFRLRLLLSNLEEHWADPQLRDTVKELLGASVDRLESAIGRLSAERNAVLAKVALDLNALLREVVERPSRRVKAAGRTPVRLALGAVRPIWGDAY